MNLAADWVTMSQGSYTAFKIAVVSFLGIAALGGTAYTWFKTKNPFAALGALIIGAIVVAAAIRFNFFVETSGNTIDRVKGGGGGGGW
ncbi:hypothetical protein [Tsukamurella hominis]|uniref:hypothetical protein n=1 Tax=Tsukamurella hominis TaxID=1970232 RepID=UPI0039EA81FC